MNDFEKFKHNILETSSPLSQKEIESMIDEINQNAHKKDLFTEQLKCYLTDIPIFSVEVSKKVCNWLY